MVEPAYQVLYRKPFILYMIRPYGCEVIAEEAWESLYSDVSRPFPKPQTGRIAVKVINHLGDEVMKLFGVG
jgi:hypothetical protein